MDATIEISDVDEITIPKRSTPLWIHKSRLLVAFQQWNRVIHLGFVAFVLLTLSLLRSYVLFPFFRNIVIPKGNVTLPQSGSGGEWYLFAFFVLMIGIFYIVCITLFPVLVFINLIQYVVRIELWQRTASSCHKLSQSDVAYMTSCYKLTLKFSQYFRSTMLCAYALYPAMHMFGEVYLNAVLYYSDGEGFISPVCERPPYLHYLIPIIWIEAAHIFVTFYGGWVSGSWQREIMYTWYLKWIATKNMSPDIPENGTGYKAFQIILKRLDSALTEHG
ncbi:uncharacterized protein LOC129599898 [Paramacrobiotus metropolitanus]|uniref:uncharacterized protein LOC129599898 n=1 Tax=Paramacrobiotus metropolitanus TaxID=2943436 RepID=UPI002445F5E2|nr:uncharacterized protein LOC129599898 [Paramacrobiotus metropolitanus]XP_055354227.1 uncharacterized protein LOC129599898 [Paramacrobiotus metropolitanus]